MSTDHMDDDSYHSSEYSDSGEHSYPDQAKPAHPELEAPSYESPLPEIASDPEGRPGQSHDGRLPYQMHRKFNNLNNPTHDSNDSMRRHKRRNQMNRIKNKFFKKHPNDKSDPGSYNGGGNYQNFKTPNSQMGPGPAYPQGPSQVQAGQTEMILEEVEGVVHLMDRYQGYMRFAKQSFFPRPNDPWISKEHIERFGLRTGLTITGKVGLRKDRKTLMEITSIEGEPPQDWHMVPYFHSLTSVNPYEFFNLSTSIDTDKSMTLLELFTPIGMGQRALIVAPPRAGKTILMEKIVNGITANHPDVEAMVLLVDERPEEVTHMQRRVKAKVYASCLDKPIAEHVAVSRMVIEMAQRKAERGKNVVLLLDSITRMARAFNNQLKSTGRTLTGGVDAQALTEPKKFFGSARKNEEGGSLTIIATALVQTGSQMDEVIFQEFKGTGNMELVLSRKLAEKRIYPALDINQSGTRREELILPPSYYKASIKFRRYLSTLGENNQIPAALQAVEKYRTTEAFVREFV